MLIRIKYEISGDDEHGETYVEKVIILDGKYDYGKIEFRLLTMINMLIQELRGNG
jgi:hypothetical protein